MDSDDLVIRLTEAEFLERLSIAAKRASGVNELARRWGVDSSNLAKVIRGERRPGAQLLERLRAREERFYVLGAVKDDRTANP